MYHSVHPPTPRTSQWYRLQVSNAMATGQDQKVGPNLLSGWMGLSNHSCLQGGHMWHARGSTHEFTFCNTHRSLHHLYFALGCAQQTASAVLHIKRGEKRLKQVARRGRFCIWLRHSKLHSRGRPFLWCVYVYVHVHACTWEHVLHTLTASSLH